MPAKADSQDPANAKPKPVQIKVGISDGIMTEVIEGLEAGTQVATGAILPSGGGNSPTANPFGGPRFGRF